jgi:quercetin 2,3-dioxygenase
LLFLYSDYYDPENLRFGVLRAFNEFLIQPGKGFLTHPHSKIEITTVVLEGELTHEDNMGNREVLEAGGVQCITTGKGIERSEFNIGKEFLHLYQIWVSPSKCCLDPRYSKKKFEASSWKNRLIPLVSGQDSKAALKISADSTIYRASLERGYILHFNSEEERLIFMYISAGELFVNGQGLGPGDQARIELEKTLHLQTDSFAVNAEFILIDVPPVSSKNLKEI